MELIIMLLAPFPIGFFVKNRMAAYLSYITVHGFAFTYQSTYLVLFWIGGESTAFGTYPNPDEGEILAYGGVNLAIFLVGLGLVALGQWLAARRRRTAAANRGPHTAAEVAS
ncbi:hypothetical protein ACFQE5_10370 [Pseudonocardia hispaniensis]|uniref:Integral membrane protein n=1 Tax=Pseudonocardia hispaniensis TaxID=904933 RepID=A0ABW1J2C1_9PSEU